MAIRTLVVKIGAEATDVQSAFAKIGSDARGLQDTLAKVGQLPNGAAVIAQFDQLQKNITRVSDAQRRLATDSENAARGILAIGGPARLTSTQLDEMAKTVTKGIDAFRALGQQAPAELQKVARAIQQQQAALAQAAKPPASLTGGFGGLLPIGAAATVTTAFVEGAKAAIQYADSLEKLKDRTGITEQALQTLDAIAKPSGNTLEEIATAINRFQKNIESGDTQAVQAIEALGLSVVTLKSLSPDEQFIAIAKAIQTIQDPAEQTFRAIQLFGRGGAEILPSLKAKVDELAGSTFKMSAGSVRALDELGDGFGRMKTDAINALGEVLGKLVEFEGRFPGFLSGASIPGVLGAVGLDLADRLSSALPQAPLPSINSTQSFLLGNNSRGGPLGFQGVPGDNGQFQGFLGAFPVGQSPQNTAAIDAVTTALHAQEAAADALGLSLEDYVKKLDAANTHQQQLIQGTSGLSFSQKQQILAFQQLGLSVEEISVKTGISQTAVRLYEEELKTLFDTMAANTANTGKLQKDIGATAVGFNAAGQAVVGFSGLLQAEVGGLQVFEKGLESVIVQFQRFGQFNAAGFLQAGGVFSPSNRSTGTLPSVQLGGIGTLPNVTPVNTQLIHDALDTTVKWKDDLGELSTALSHLGQVSSGTFGDIVNDLHNIVSSLDVVDKGVHTFQTATTASGKIAGVASGIAGILQATSSQSRFANVAGGALAGAEFGAGTGIGALTGAGVGALIGFIRSQDTVDVQQIASDVGRDIGTHISDGMATQLADDVARFGPHVAAILNLDQILANDPNLAGRPEAAAVQAQQLFGLDAQAKLTASQISDEFGKVFAVLLPKSISTFTGLASDSFQHLIQLARQFGVESQALTDFTNSQINDNILAGLNSIATVLGGLTRTTKQFGIQSAETADALGSSLFVAFQELVANGETWLQALQQILPTFTQLDAALKKSGFSGGQAFEALRPLFDLIKDPGVSAALTEIGGLSQVLAGLANLDRLNPALLAGLGNQIGSIFTSLVGSGKNRDDILQLIAPSLQQLFELQQRNPTVQFDKETQDLLTEAVSKGLVGDQFKSAQERTIDAIKRTNFILEQIAAHSGISTVQPKPSPTPTPGPTPTTPVPPPSVPTGPGEPGGPTPLFVPPSGKVLPFRSSGTVAASLPVSGALDASALFSAIREDITQSFGSVTPYVDQRNSIYLDENAAQKISKAMRQEIAKGGIEQTAWRRVTR